MRVVCSTSGCHMVEPPFEFCDILKYNEVSYYSKICDVKSGQRISGPGAATFHSTIRT
jgi:hypothetical protein